MPFGDRFGGDPSLVLGGRFVCNLPHRPARCSVMEPAPLRFLACIFDLAAPGLALAPAVGPWPRSARGKRRFARGPCNVRSGGPCRCSLRGSSGCSSRRTADLIAVSAAAACRRAKLRRRTAARPMTTAIHRARLYCGSSFARRPSAWRLPRAVSKSLTSVFGIPHGTFSKTSRAAGSLRQFVATSR